MNLPSFEGYGNYSDELGNIRALKFSMAGVDVYYSYKTPVAFRQNGLLVIRENDWGPTTEKHLNAIDSGDKKNRLPGDVFESALSLVMAGL